MKIELNKNCTPFCDKEGQYVEVICILPTKVVTLYSKDQIISVDLENTNLKVGDKIYFNDDGTFKSVVTKQVESTVSTSNKQSPSRLPTDPNARF